MFRIIFYLVCFFGFPLILFGQKTIMIDGTRLRIKDTLIIASISSGEYFTQIPNAQGERMISLPLNKTELISIKDAKSAHSHLAIFSPGDTSTLIPSIDFYHTASLADSLQNYIWQRCNQTIGSFNKFIKPDQDYTEQIMAIFDQLNSELHQHLDAQRANLTTDVYALLSYQASARVYNFLMINGRIFRKLAAHDPYFEFIHKIPLENKFTSTLPDVVLYRIEIEYLRKYTQMSTLSAFLDYLEERILDKDLEDFLKVSYINLISGNPHYWPLHQPFLTQDNLNSIRVIFSKNKYKEKLWPLHPSAFARLGGQLAPDFKALNGLGQTVRLSDLKSKHILIDVWTTWCGPCRAQRPQMQLTAEKFDQRLNVIYLSMDEDLNAWKAYLKKGENSNLDQELWLEPASRDKFRADYLVQFYPKYILIDPKGRIIDANWPEPSWTADKLLLEILSK